MHKEASTKDVLQAFADFLLFIYFQLFLFHISSAHVLTHTSMSFSWVSELNQMTLLYQVPRVTGLCSSGEQQLHQHYMTYRWVPILVQQHISLAEYITLHSSLHTQNDEKWYKSNIICT